MNKYYNIDTFFDNEEKIDPTDIDIANLLWFVSTSKSFRTLLSKDIFVCKYSKITDNKNNYTFKYKNKSYGFSVFSDRELQKNDQKILKSLELRRRNGLARTLKLACSLDLVNPKVLVGKSSLGIFEVLITYQENGIKKVINYVTNLVMNKDDYYELFNFNEYNELSKFDLYNIYYFLDKLNNYNDIYYYLLFWKEISNDIGKNFGWLFDRYNSNGINLNNYLLVGNNCESLFFQSIDRSGTKYDKIKVEINAFTMDPDVKQKHIKYNRNKSMYEFKDRKFGYFSFDLLSDIVGEHNAKMELLSDDRYGKCHQNSIRVANSLKKENKQYAYVVGGRVKCNDVDYFLHSWVEVEIGEDGIVIDFNRNIIMNRKKYYKLYEAKQISKTHIYDMNEIIKTVVEDAGFTIHPLEIVYFGKELMDDLKKNELVLKRSINN